MTFTQFCENMTEAINNKAIMTGDNLIDVATVAQMPEAISAYTMTICVSQIAQ